MQGEPFLPIKALPVDMFPQTDGVELVVLFARGEEAEKEQAIEHEKLNQLKKMRQAEREKQRQNEMETGGDGEGKGTLTGGYRAGEKVVLVDVAEEEVDNAKRLRESEEEVETQEDSAKRARVE